MGLFDTLFQKSQTLDMQGAVDIHCHLLPGVDDGVVTIDEALEILRQYEDMGFKRIWLTPHIMEDVPNETDALRQRFAELKKAYTGPIELNLAAENMIDSLFMDRLEANDFLPIINDSTLLVETSYFSAPLHLEDKFERIKSAGYFPLLAHPERYNYIDSMATYRKYHDMGVRFQMNFMSLAGHYGPMVKEKALKLLSAGLIDLVGTDMHRIEHLYEIADMRVPKKTRDQVYDLIARV